MVIDAWRWRDALQDSRNLETFDGALNLDCALQAFLLCSHQLKIPNPSLRGVLFRLNRQCPGSPTRTSAGRYLTDFDRLTRKDKELKNLSWGLNS